jgi:Leucine-rich repeat (LRR) protein
LAITSLPALSYLDLSSDWLHGSILSEFGNMPHLTQLGFAFNNLTGRIPASLRNLTTLVVLAIGKKTYSPGQSPRCLGTSPV